MRVHLKGINTVRKRLADGTVRVHRYHRATGHPLPGDVGSTEFMVAYSDAERSIANRLKGTFSGLFNDFTRSKEFEKLAVSTQSEYKRLLMKVEREFGDMPVIGALDDPKSRQDFMEYRTRVAKSSGEREADNRLSAVSAMAGWAVQNGRMGINPIAGFRRLYHSDRSELIWTPEQIANFMAVAPVELQRAMILALHTGQRQGDLLRLGWSNYDGIVLRLRQGKSRRHGRPGPVVEVPVTAVLKRMLDSMPRVSTTILTSLTGMPFRKRHFSKLWGEAAAVAGIEDRHFHDVRGTTVTLLSEAGATPQQIAAITGHSQKSIAAILDKYLARTRGLAEQAIFHFENSPRTEFANRLQTSPDVSKGKRGTHDA